MFHANPYSHIYCRKSFHENIFRPTKKKMKEKCDNIHPFILYSQIYCVSIVCKECEKSTMVRVKSLWCKILEMR